MGQPTGAFQGMLLADRPQPWPKGIEPMVHNQGEFSINEIAALPQHHLGKIAAAIALTCN